MESIPVVYIGGPIGVMKLPSLLMKHKLDSCQMKQYVVRHVLPINEKSKDIIITNIHNGMLPNKVYVGFVKTSAYTGSVTTNPYNFLNILQLMKC